MTMNLNMPSQLYLGTSRETAMALGPRQFRSAIKAIRFAMEHAAPVSRRGALLKIGGRELGPAAIANLHEVLVAQADPVQPSFDHDVEEI